MAIKSTSHWNDGSSTSTQPRILHDTSNVVLLVGAVYQCSNNHWLLAHDETILKRFPMYHSIPFVLLSRTGFTTDMVNMCTSLFTHGMNFCQIETFILERRLDECAKQIKMLSILSKKDIVFDYEKSPLSKSPSNDIISKVVLVKFLKDENQYLREITAIPVGRSISFDHTFRVAANIGYLREDGVWVPQYMTVFLLF